MVPVVLVRKEVRAEIKLNALLDYVGYVMIRDML